LDESLLLVVLCVAFHPMLLLLRVYSNLYIGRLNLNSPAAAAAATPSVSLFDFNRLCINYLFVQY
jgi:hypothetical protein